MRPGRAFIGAALALVFGTSLLSADQAVITPLDPDETSGTQLANKLTLFEGALLSTHSGTTAPSYGVLGTPWLDTSKVGTGGYPVLRRYDGSAWLAEGVLDTDRDVALPPEGPLTATGGSGTAYTLATGYAPESLYDGARITFRAHTTNTGNSATVNVNTLGAFPLRRAPGIEVLPGTVVEGSLYRATFSTPGEEWVLDNPFGAPSPGYPGQYVEMAGFIPPDRTFATDGACVSRSVYVNLYNAITVTLTGTGNSGQAILTGLTGIQTIGIAQGVAVEGTGVPAGAVLKSIDSSSQVTLSANLTTSGSRSLRFFPYGACDGSTTFALPNTKGKTLVTRDNQGGTAANVAQVSTTVTSSNGSATITVGSASGIARGMVVAARTIPAGVTVANISGTTITLSSGTGVIAGSGVAARFSYLSDANALGGTGGSPTKVQVEAELAQHDHPDDFILPNHAHHDNFSVNRGSLGLSGSQQGGMVRNLDQDNSPTTNNDGGQRCGISFSTSTLDVSGQPGLTGGVQSPTSNPAIVGDVLDAGSSHPMLTAPPAIAVNTFIYY